MRKFLNTLSLCLAILAIGSWLNATPYPIGNLFPLVSDGTNVTMETGKFGIGTSNPQELLHVGAGTDSSDISATDLLVTRAGPSNLSVRDSTNDVETFLFSSTVGGIIGTITNDPLNIKTNNTSAISIDTSQNVSLGTLTASEIVITDASKNLTSAAVATYPSLAEFIHVKGVTSALQTQIDGKQPLDSELTTIAALTETNGNVMFVAGGVWTSDATPAIDCTDCTNVGGGGHPVVDTTSLVEGSADGSKEIRIEVDGISASTIRVWTAPDENVDLGLIDNVSNVHGLGASVNVLGNRDASGEFIQRLGTDDQTLGSIDRPVYEANGTITFAVAFSANPIVVTGGAESSNTDQWAGVRNISTTAFLLSTFGINSGVSITNIGWVALGT